MKGLKHSYRTGLAFGLTSATITTLGLMIGLNSGTHSKMVVIGGILTIAIADSFSDALGIHVSEESDKRSTTKNVWESTISAFLAKFVFALTFMIPILLFKLSTAVIVSAVWGLSVLTILSYLTAVHRKTQSWKVIGEHLGIALVVIVLTHFVGKWIAVLFG